MRIIRLCRSAETNPIQTQFAQKPRMNVNSALTKDYKNQPFPRPPENKPNQACPEQRRMDPISSKAKNERNPSSNKGLQKQVPPDTSGE